MSSNSVCNHTRDLQIRLPLRGGPILLSLVQTELDSTQSYYHTYSFQCDPCDAGYVGYTRLHLHNRAKGHKQQSSVIAKHYKTRTCTGQ